MFPDWKTWLTALGVAGAVQPRSQSFGDAGLAIRAAVSGLGVMLAWSSLVADDLVAGRLWRDGMIDDPRGGDWRIASRRQRFSGGGRGPKRRRQFPSHAVQASVSSGRQRW